MYDAPHLEVKMVEKIMVAFHLSGMEMMYKKTSGRAQARMDIVLEVEGRLV